MKFRQRQFELPANPKIGDRVMIGDNVARVYSMEYTFTRDLTTLVYTLNMTPSKLFGQI